MPPPDLLPVLPLRFVARDEDTAAVRELLCGEAAGPIVGLVAMGGAGVRRGCGPGRRARCDRGR